MILIFDILHKINKLEICDVEMPILYISNVPKDIIDKSYKYNIPTILVRLTSQDYWTEISTLTRKHGYVFSIKKYIARSLVCKYIDFVNMYSLDENIIYKICYRNCVLINYLGLSRELGGLSNIDKFYISDNDKYINDIDLLNKELIISNDIHYQLILYISELIYKTTLLHSNVVKIKEELKLAITSCVLSNNSNKIDALYNICNKNINDLECENNHMLIQMASEIRDLLKKIKAYKIISIDIVNTIQHGIISMEVNDSLALLVAQLYFLFAKYNKIILITNHIIWKKIKVLMYKSMHQYIYRIIFIDVEDLVNSFYFLLDAFYYITNKYTFCYFDDDKYQQNYLAILYLLKYYKFQVILHSNIALCENIIKLF
jgi:hypothetical protein